MGYVGGRGEEEGGVKHEDSVAANSLVCFDKAKTEHGTSDAGNEKKIIDNLLVRIHFIIVMIWWTGLAPWEFEFSFPGSLTFTFLGTEVHSSFFPSSLHSLQVLEA